MLQSETMADRVAVHELDEALAGPEATRAVETTGPGVTALRTLFASGEPKPARVVEIIDKHRSERDAIFAFLQTHAGNGYVARVQAELEDLRVSVARREVVAGDPTRPEEGFFHASADRRGAAWRTESGAFSGSIDQSRTAMRYEHDEDTAVRADVDHRARTGSVALEQDGAVVGELGGRYGGSSDYHVGLSRPFDLGEGRTASAGVRHQERPVHGASDVVAGSYRDPSTTAEGFVGRHESGGVTAGGTFSHAVDERTAVTGAFEHSPVATSGHVTGTRQLGDGRSAWGSVRRQERPEHGTSDVLAGGYRDATTSADGYVGRHESGGLAAGGTFSRALDDRSSVSGAFDHSPVATTASVSGSTRPSDHLSLSASASHVERRHGPDVTSLTVSEQYSSDRIRQRMDLSAERGPDGTHARGAGSIDAQLGPSVYAGAFGSFDSRRDVRETLGASLTFTPHEKAALTLAGILDSSGAFEARLQLDVFKKRIEGLSTIADHKKDALVSLFLSYTSGAAPGMLDERYGRSQLGTVRGTGEGTIGAGIRIRF